MQAGGVGLVHPLAQHAEREQDGIEFTVAGVRLLNRLLQARVAAVVAHAALDEKIVSAAGRAGAVAEFEVVEVHSRPNLAKFSSMLEILPL